MMNTSIRRKREVWSSQFSRKGTKRACMFYKAGPVIFLFLVTVERKLHE